MRNSYLGKEKRKQMWNDTADIRNCGVILKVSLHKKKRYKKKPENVAGLRTFSFAQEWINYQLLNEYVGNSSWDFSLDSNNGCLKLLRIWRLSLPLSLFVPLISSLPSKASTLSVLIIIKTDNTDHYVFLFNIIREVFFLVKRHLTLILVRSRHGKH